jgi:hypothetical protein
MNQEYNQDVEEMNQEALNFCKEFGVGYNNYTHLLSKGFVLAKVEPTDPDSPELFAPQKMVEDVCLYFSQIIGGLVEDNKRLSAKLVSSPVKPIKIAVEPKQRNPDAMSKGQLIYEAKASGVTWKELGETHGSKQPLMSAKKYALSRKLPFPPTA